MFLCVCVFFFFFFFFFCFFFVKKYVVGTHLNCIDKSMKFKWVHTTYAFIKEVDKKYTGCNLKTTELLDCVLIGVCALIRLTAIIKFNDKYNKEFKHQGPVVQSIVSLTSSLRVISLTVLADSIYNILIFFAEKM